MREAQEREGVMVRPRRSVQRQRGQGHGKVAARGAPANRRCAAALQDTLPHNDTHYSEYVYVLGQSNSVTEKSCTTPPPVVNRESMCD